MTHKKQEFDTIQEIINKSEDDFEQKLTYISAGALVLSLSFFTQLLINEKTICVSLLIIGWGLLVLTLLINLTSHLISKKYLLKAQDSIDEAYEHKMKTISKSNRKIEFINICTLISLILGISIIVIFASINIIHN